jgi:hypothetical protein
MMRTKLLPTAVLLALLAALASAAAQDLTAKVKEAEALAAQGKYVEAVAALDDAATALWDRAPLGFRRALWVAEKANGFGAYNPRENGIYSAGMPMLAYAEPIGFGWQQSGEIWRTDMIADVVVKATDGKQLFRQEEFQRLQLASRVRNREFMVNFTFTLSGIPKGDYLLETTLRDQVTGKKGAFTLPFAVR